jgi:hypothetical protein
MQRNENYAYSCGYEADRKGKIYDPRHRRVTLINSGGYELFRVDGFRVFAHRLVWLCFHGEIPDGYVIHHENRRRDDNRIENLLAMSPADHADEHR